MLFIGGNDLFIGFHQSAAELQELEELALLADELIPLASKKVYVISIPSRGQDTANKKRAEATNDYLKNSAENSRWEYRGICCKIYSVEKHLDEDDVHLSGSALGGICTILKKKISVGTQLIWSVLVFVSAAASTPPDNFNINTGNKYFNLLKVGGTGLLVP